MKAISRSICSRLRELLDHFFNRHAGLQVFEKDLTGVRVPRKSQAPLTLPGMLSTAGHSDQSSAMIPPPDLYRV